MSPPVLQASLAPHQDSALDSISACPAESRRWQTAALPWHVGHQQSRALFWLTLRSEPPTELHANSSGRECDQLVSDSVVNGCHCRILHPQQTDSRSAILSSA